MSKKFALVVGIANYLHLKKLDGSIIDASLVANQLQQNGYRVFATLHDCDAGQVTTALSKYSNEVADGDQFLFYFSGHGAVMQIDGVKQYGMYFLPAYEENNEFQVLSLKNLLAYSKKLPKWKNVDCAYIFDACRSDLSEPDGKIKRANHQSHKSALGTEKLFHQYAEDFGVSIVSSCGDGKVSQELPKNNSGRKGGLFTVGLLDVWNERIESGKSMVLEPDSLDSVQKRMAELHPAAAEKDPQQPFMAGSSIVLSEAKKSPNAQATPDTVNFPGNGIVGNAALQSNRSLFDLYLRIGQLDAPMGECARDILNNLQFLGESTEKLNESRARYQEAVDKAKILGAANDIEEKAWRDALASQSITGYQNYLSAYPDGKYANQSRGLIGDEEEKTAWQDVQRANTISSYENYLLLYPQGKYAGEAHRLVEKIKKRIANEAAEKAESEAWQLACAQNTVPSYQNYLYSYPQGTYATLAGTRINGLKITPPEPTRPPRPPNPPQEPQRPQEPPKSSGNIWYWLGAILFWVAVFVFNNQNKTPNIKSDLSNQKTKVSTPSLAPPTFLPNTYNPDPTKLASASRFTVVKAGECIKDSETGLLWELKSKDGGLRDWKNEYTNHGDGSGGDASEYVKAVNAQGLCGYRDWRLPSAREQASLVYCSSGKTKDSNNVGDGGAQIVNLCDGSYTRPTTHAALADNTRDSWYWTSTKYSGGSSSAWLVLFGYGGVGYGQRAGTYHVRLVR